MMVITRGKTAMTSTSVILALALVACSNSGGNDAKASPTSPTTSTQAPSTRARPTTSTPAASPTPTTVHLAPGSVATVTSAGTSLEDSSVSYDGTFSLAVSPALGASKRSNGDTVVSVFTTIRAISGTPALNSAALHLLPEDHPDENFNTADLNFEGAYDPVAWQNASRGRPPLGKAFGTADAVGNIPLAAGRTYQGAVWFVLSPNDRPTHIAYSAFDAEGSLGVGEQATWLFSMPGVMAKRRQRTPFIRLSRMVQSAR